MHPVVELAREAVEEYVRTGRIIQPPVDLRGVLALRAGVFVCLKKSGQLRGCIGTITPVTPSVAHETVRNAVAAATQDTRFPPVDVGELEGLEYSVDVLTPPEPVVEKSQLDPGKYGVIVSRGSRKGLLLPDLKGVETVDEQLRIASLKAGIDPHEEDISIERFEVKRYR